MGDLKLVEDIGDVQAIQLEDAAIAPIVIQWDLNNLTYEAELAALRFFTEEKRPGAQQPSPRSYAAFRMLLDFQAACPDYENLMDEFPHLKDVASPGCLLPRYLVNRFRSLNQDHLRVFENLTRIPNGLYFVNGCPGAGKTDWNMLVAALIQSKCRPLPNRRRTQILFLVDINSTVDEAADRYFQLCQKADLKLSIIRMHGWPYEMRTSEKMNGTREDKSTAPDFTKKFLTTAGLVQGSGLVRDRNTAPTLDEAAWEYFESKSKTGATFGRLRKLLAIMETGVALTTEDWKSLRTHVSKLYQTVLSSCDFIATTPVAAYGRFANMFSPDVIFVDEAPHARELTTLIPIAYFSPSAWILTGDVKQTRPFVKGANKKEAERDGLKPNPYAQQMRVSLMARAYAAGAISNKLLINNRAYGYLHRLPSTVFYGDEMVSRRHGEAMYPSSVAYLQTYLEKLSGSTGIEENRIIVNLEGNREEKWRTSYWNPTNHRWLLNQVRLLLQDTAFRAMDDQTRGGRVMIQTPYSTSVRQYHDEIETWPEEWQNRVNVVTVDRAQGNQADMVFLDMVRTSAAGFMDDAQRLNVAITRARQAEIILMHPRMGYRGFGASASRSLYTSQLWDDTARRGRVFHMTALDDSSDALEQPVDNEKPAVAAGSQAGEQVNQPNDEGGGTNTDTEG